MASNRTYSLPGGGTTSNLAEAQSAYKAYNAAQAQGSVISSTTQQAAGTAALSTAPTTSQGAADQPAAQVPRTLSPEQYAVEAATSRLKQQGTEPTPAAVAKEAGLRLTPEIKAQVEQLEPSQVSYPRGTLFEVTVTQPDGGKKVYPTTEPERFIAKKEAEITAERDRLAKQVSREEVVAGGIGQLLPTEFGAKPTKYEEVLGRQPIVTAAPAPTPSEWRPTGFAIAAEAPQPPISMGAGYRSLTKEESLAMARSRSPIWQFGKGVLEGGYIGEFVGKTQPEYRGLSDLPDTTFAERAYIGGRVGGIVLDIFTLGATTPLLQTAKAGVGLAKEIPQVIKAGKLVEPVVRFIGKYPVLRTAAQTTATIGLAEVGYGVLKPAVELRLGKLPSTKNTVDKYPDIYESAMMTQKPKLDFSSVGAGAGTIGKLVISPLYPGVVNDDEAFLETVRLEGEARGLAPGEIYKMQKEMIAERNIRQIASVGGTLAGGAGSEAAGQANLAILQAQGKEVTKKTLFRAIAPAGMGEGIAQRILEFKVAGDTRPLFTERRPNLVGLPTTKAEDILVYGALGYYTSGVLGSKIGMAGKASQVAAQTGKPFKSAVYNVKRFAYESVGDILDISEKPSDYLEKIAGSVLEGRKPTVRTFVPGGSFAEAASPNYYSGGRVVTTVATDVTEPARPPAVKRAVGARPSVKTPSIVTSRLPTPRRVFVPGNIPVQPQVPVPTEPEVPPFVDIPSDVPVPVPVDVPVPVPVDIPTDVPVPVPVDIPTNVPSNVPTNVPVIGRGFFPGGGSFKLSEFMGGRSWKTPTRRKYKYTPDLIALVLNQRMVVRQMPALKAAYSGEERRYIYVTESTGGKKKKHKGTKPKQPKNWKMAKAPLKLGMPKTLSIKGY